MQVYDIAIGPNQRETTQHGSFDFPMAVYTTQISKNILRHIAWHWHEELQFCIITQGMVEFFINGEVIRLIKGEGIFVNVGQLHQAKNYLQADGAYICIDFHPKMISGFLGSVIYTKYMAPYTDPCSPPFYVLKQEQNWQRNILNNLIGIYTAYTQQENFYELQIQILLFKIWQTLVKKVFSKQAQKGTKVWGPRIKKMIDYINNHYMETFRLEDLASEVNLSKSACCREFKKHVKCTVFEYLLDYRIMLSTKMLLTTDQSITDIAYQCGFGSTSYFIEKFKKKSGIPPLAYRKKIINDFSQY